MQKITLNYGTETYVASVATSKTIGELLADPTHRAILGYGDNVKALVGGVEQPGSASVVGIDTIEIETRANSKAV